MNLAWLSLGALVAALVTSCLSRLNVGVLAISLAWLVGAYWGGMPVKQLAAGFPSELFLTLAGVTLFFSQAQTNGTLDQLVVRGVRLCRGRIALLPVMFFLLAALVASAGPGNIATAALLAPPAMAAASRSRIPPFLMAIMVGNGANSGALSPLAPTGIIVNGIMDRIGLPGAQLDTWTANLLAHASVALAGYAAFGGLKLARHGKAGFQEDSPPAPLTKGQWITLILMAALLAAVLFARANIGMAAFTAAAILSFAGAASEREAIQAMPWNTLLMVSGVTVLIALLEKTQGIDLFANLLAKISTRESVTAVVAFVTGLVSAYSSTSGVVLPAFLPTVPALADQLGGGRAYAIAGAMNVGGHLVDVSPLSTIGALCVASVASQEESRKLFHQLLAWGLSMTAIGAIFCYLYFR
ncbi:MAG: SLC13 family permease [Bryobacteraceae bacterium]|nr:SLC13 family permease [Bryobacteraceae bacterium]MDW8378665.1 SLC13 family permease [Bryobacterales bacterium]